MSDGKIVLHGMVPQHLKVRQTRILLESLEVLTDIGFHDFEVGVPQRLLITVELWLDHHHAPGDDNPESAWNYDMLRGEVIRIAQDGRYNLQETLVHAIFERLAAARGVAALRIKSVKPDVYADAAGVGVEIMSYVGERP